MQKEESRELQDNNVAGNIPTNPDADLTKQAEELVELVMTDPKRYTVGEVYEMLRSRMGGDVSEDELRNQIARIMEKVEENLKQTKA